MKKAVFVIFAAVLAISAGAADNNSILTGQFNPIKEPGFVSLQSLGIQIKNGPHYLQREAAESLARMMKDFKKENPKVPFWVQSSTRNFASQKSIWNAKWRGERSSNGVDASKENDPVRRARLILEYSSMPGTSRHHWGTDADFNMLQNDYYERGEGKILFSWLTKNAARYGFVRPYTPLRSGGYREERWHWSYVPLAKKYLHEWLAKYGNDMSFFMQKGLFDGCEQAGKLAREYVETVNPECL
jgi:zinc D-Ala-D-Ala carboxypeptidase